MKSYTKELEYLRKYVKDNNLSEDYYKDVISKLKEGKPIQYIIGNVDFYGNYIKVNENVLIPRFETELLVEKAVKYIRNKFSSKIKILDIGTGSGCIAISLSKLVNADITATDISSAALDVAIENNNINNTTVKFIESDIFSNISDRYDVIISNPPYIAYDEEIMDIVKNNEPHIALYANNDGLYFYDKILKDCKKYLNDNFIIAFEIGYMQGKSIEKMAYNYLGNICVNIEKDYSGKDRFVFIMNKE